MDEIEEFTWKFLDENSGFSVMFEDDGRVAYAYILDPDGNIVGDVWLYNRCAAPAEPEWHDKSQLPFANPASFVRGEARIKPVSNVCDVSVQWKLMDDGQPRANILIRNHLAGVLSNGSKPGWSTQASRNGPLAKAFDDI